MVNKLLFRNHIAVNTISNLKFCAINHKKDNLWLLRNPQLIYDLSQDNNKLTKQKLVKSILFNSIDQVEKDSLIAFSNKIDKKNKVNIRVNNDSSDNNIKKSKVKTKKRIKNHINLSRDDFLIANNEFMMETGHKEDNDLSLVKIGKSNKKKYKTKKDSFIKTIPNIQEHIVSNVEKTNGYLDKKIFLDVPLSIQELSNKLNVSEAAIITWLFLKGISVTINQVVDIAIAIEVAKHYGFTVLEQEHSSISNDIVKNHENHIEPNLVKGIQRAPIITIFGHVDHGKTTLLDSIRKTNLVQLEAGGITQSLKAYEVEFKYLSSTEKLIFLDTPGHEAFSQMRLRGAEVTDLAILVVAADDGLKPQSIEAIDHIITRNIPYVVAINKIDKENVNSTNVRAQLAKYNIISHEWGGTSEIIEVSALKDFNIDLLLSALCKLSKKQDLSAASELSAQGTILETYLDIRTGSVANIVVQNGTLKIGDIIVAGNLYGRVKLIKNSSGNKLKQAGPSSIVSIWGFSSTPQAGLKFQVVNNEKHAKNLIDQNTNKLNNISNLLNTRVTLDSYKHQSNLKLINVIIKADTQGSIEAIINAFFQIPQNKVQINVLTAHCGSISNKDIELAITSNAIILGFNINMTSNVRHAAERSGVIIKLFNIIYSLLDYMQQYMLNLVDTEYNQILIGKATVQTVFNINKGTVAGCLVNSGKLIKNAYIKVYSNKELVYSGLIDSLKRVKDNVEEVVEGYECGLMCSEYSAWYPLDIIEVYEMVEKVKTL